MSDTRLNKTGLTYFYNRIKNLFASKAEVSVLSGRIDDLISEGGEPNKIESISVNGAAVTPDSLRNVSLTIPASSSDLSDGSTLATKTYVDENGGKIDLIKVNGTDQTIASKSVDILVPTKTSDLTNDSGFQTANDVQSAIESMVSSAFKYKGSVDTVADLPASGNEIGDVYDVLETGVNYAWDGTTWDALGHYIDTSEFWKITDLVAITTAEIDDIVDGTSSGS